MTFPTWGEPGDQDDLVWYTGYDLGGGTWYADIDLANHKSGNPEYGTFHTHVYADNVVLCAATTWTRVLPAAPSCSSAAPQASSTTATSGLFRIYAYGVSNATSIKFPTWGDPGGQDDLVWYTGYDQGGGTWYADVDLANHKSGNPEYGTFTTHVYVSGPGGSNVLCAYTNWTRTAPPTPPPPQIFNDDFNSLTMSDRASNSDVLSCAGSVPANNLVMSVPSGSGNWALLVSPTYPRTWIGTTATESWSISGGQMATHAESTPSDGGLAWISRSTFDRSRYLSAVGTFALSACSVGDGRECMAGLTLINSESDYREISFRTIGFSGSNLVMEVGRFAPCDYRAFTDVNGYPIQVTANQLKTFRIDYLGPEGGGWRYYFDGNPVYLNFGNGIQLVETNSNLSDASLTGDPHIGLYWTAPSTGYYVEGRVDRATVYSLSKIAGIVATASNQYPGYPAWQAVDENTATYWSAGAGPTQWIELDLGSTRTIRKIRLESNMSGDTAHNVYVGASPAPTALAGTLSQNVTAGQWLDLDLLESGVSGRYIRITTTSAPGSVAWSEIEVYE